MSSSIISLTKKLVRKIVKLEILAGKIKRASLLLNPIRKKVTDL